MKNVFTPTALLHILIAVLAVHMLNFPFAVYPRLVTHGPTWYGLDVSWQMTLNYALKNNWVFGKDIIYTYGPLGFLATRISLGVSRWFYLLFDLFVVYNFYHMFKDFVFSAVDKFIAVLIIICFTLLVNVSHGSDLSWAITLFIYYWMYKSYKEPRILYFILMGINIVLCFYIKLNAGLIGIIFLGAHLLNLLIFKRISLLKSVSVFVGVLLATYLTSLLFHVDLYGYIRGAFDIIKGYNDVMYMEAGSNDRVEVNVSILFYSLLTLISVYLVYIIKEKKYSHIFFVGISIAYIFLLRKQSVLRNDIQHYTEFFAYGAAVLLVGNMEVISGKWQKLVSGLAFIIVLASMLFSVERHEKYIDKAVCARYASIGGYIHDFAVYNNKPALNQARKRYIPAHILSKIGEYPVDIFPWDSEYLIENHLNYSPRPIFQSFSAYTKKLQDINYQYYTSHAPEFIIYDYDAIDQRYPFNDDVTVNFFICKNYTFVDSFWSNDRWRLLLQKKQETTPLEIIRPKDGVFAINKAIPVDWTMMMEIEVKQTLSGKLQSFFYRSPVITLKVTRANGYSIKYRTSKELLKAGIMVDRWVANTRDYLKYMIDKNTLDVIKSVEIIADEDFYEKEIRVRYINVK